MSTKIFGKKSFLTKKKKKPACIMHLRYNILQIQQRIIIFKAHIQFDHDWVQIFLEKVKIVQKQTHKLSLIMLIPLHIGF